MTNPLHRFLLARFHMDALADCLTIREIENALGSLPQGINDTYDQVMERIEKLSVNRRRAVKRLLQWVSYSKRPLTLEELEHAIAVSRGTRELLTDHIISAKVLTSLSAGIVIVDENERVRLTHKTAEDYFTNRRAAFFSNGDVEITESCLAYLQLAIFESGPCESTSSMTFEARMKSHPFYGYASLFWADHARSCDPEIISPQALLFLRKKSLLEASVQALWHLDTESDNSWDVAGGIDALHFASYFGLDHIVTHLLSEGGDPNVRDSLGTTPLIYACARGHAHVADILLKAGALAHLIDRRGSTALLGTVKNRHLDLTRRLLQENDVAINAFCKPFNNYTALMLATWNSDPQTIELLLQRPELDVNLSTPNSRSNCLIVATCDNETECVKELLRHPEIDVDHQDGSGYTSTSYAALYGYVDTLSLLLNAGADTGLQDDQGGRALQRAIDYGRLDTVKLLLKHNADYTFKDLLGRTILHAAAVNDRARVLRHILETCKDLNVDTQGNQGETALHDAARHGYIATVKVLLRFGARSDIENRAGFTPVRLAREGGWTDVLDALRKAREKESKSDEKLEKESIRKADTFEIIRETSLTTAVQFDSIQVLRTRIKQATSEELNEASSDFNLTPLHCACEVPRLEVVEMLLEAGVFVDPMDSFSRTPLVLACQLGETEIVQALVMHGADVNHTKFGIPWEIALNRRETRTALFLLAQPQTKVDTNSRLLSRALGWAAAYGELHACQKLVESGAPLHLKNADGLTPSQIAMCWEQYEVEEYLAEQEARHRMASLQDLPDSEDLDHRQTQESTDDSMRPPIPLPEATADLGEVVQPLKLVEDTPSTEALKLVTPPGRQSPLPSALTLLMVLGSLVVLFAAWMIVMRASP
jgi:ankyrin repeat protein